MTRAQSAEIAETRQRLVVAAKGSAPLTRRAAAQFRHDLKQWQTWQRCGEKLPGLPRRIRRAMTPRPAQRANKKVTEIKKTGQKNATCTIKVVPVGISKSEMLGLLAANDGTCRAIAMAIIRRYRLAEDCVSACMVSACEQISDGHVAFASHEKFRAWLHTIVRFSARKVARTATYMHGDFLPSKGILPSKGRKDESPEVNEQADTHEYEELAYPDEFEDDARVVGVSKRCATADDQLSKMTFQV